MKAKIACRRTLPHGSRRAIAQALDVAIDALEGREFNPIPSARPRLARKLRAARAALLARKIIWP